MCSSALAFSDFQEPFTWLFLWNQRLRFLYLGICIVSLHFFGMETV